MKKLYFLLVLLISLSFSALGQQRPQFSQYMVNNYLINPAVAGAYEYLNVRFGFRDQWTNIEGAPRSFFLSATSPIRILKGCDPPSSVRPTIGVKNYRRAGGLRSRNERLTRRSVSIIDQGLGALFTYDETGAFTRLMFYGSYALHVNFYDKLNVSFGLQGGLINYNLDFGGLNPNQENDPALGEGSVNSLVPDLAFGALAYTDKFYFGVSLNQILQNSLEFETQNPDPANQLKIHYYITGGARIKIFNNERWQFIPSGLIKVVQGLPASWDLNARVAYDIQGKKGVRNNLWMGVSYRNQDAIVGLVGVSLAHLIDINYSYDFDVSDLRPGRIFNPHTHEVTLGLRLYCKGRLKNYIHNLF